MAKDPYEVKQDFGFTFASEDDFTDKTEVDILKAEACDALDEVYKMIDPLLNNLQKDPEKDIIKWPGRAEKVKTFQDSLKKKIDGLKITFK